MLQRLSGIATAALLALMLVTPVAAANGVTARGPVTLSGSLEHLHGDAGGRKIDQGWHLVKDDGGSVALDVSDREPADADAGKRARVNGAMKGHKLVVGAGGLQVSAQSAGAALRGTSGRVAFAAGGATAGATAQSGSIQALITKKIAVLLINFTTNASQPYTTQQVADAFFGPNPTGSVATFYSEQSYGAWALTGDVFGYYTVAGVTSTCDWSTWGSLARTAAANAGVNLGSYSNVVHLFTGQGTCGWSGLAYLPGTYSFLNGTDSTYVAAHELGHNFGVHHASTTYCTSGGVRVAISSTCSASEYGDPYDVMGGAARLTSNWHRRQEGQLSTADQQTVTGSGTYTVGVVESATPAAPRIVRVARGDGTYLYLEYRQPGGVFDNFAASAPPVDGVLVRIAPDSSLVQSMLVDATPTTSTYYDAGLTVGQSVWDPIGGISLRTVSVDANGAVVEVTIGSDSTPPSAVGNLSAAALSPSSARLSWTAATDNIGVTGYRVSRAGVSDVSVAASPWTDTSVAAGTTATWTVSARDAAGNWGLGTDVSVTMPPPDTSPPTVVGNLVATVVTSTSVKLSWSAATDDWGVTGYRISRAGRFDVTVAASPWTESGLGGGQTYTWTVLAYDAAGNSGPGTDVSVTLAAGDISAPTAVGSLTATLTSLTSAKLAWTAATDNVGVKGYRISRAGMNDVLTSNRNWNNSGLVTGATYTWYVRAYDAAGNLGPASSVTLTIIDLIAPAKPTNLPVTNLTAGQAVVKWNTSKDNLKVMGYRIYRDGLLVKTTANRSWTDAVAAGAHSWWVTAYDASGNVSLPSTTVSLITH